MIELLIVQVIVLKVVITRGDIVHVCNFPDNALCSGWRQGLNGIEDDNDWTVNRGKTPSVNTGPNGDHSPSKGGYYVYLETTNVKHRSMARLYSCNYTHNGSTELQFWYHMKGVFLGSLNVYEMVVSNATEKLVWSKSDEQADDWIEARINLTTSGPFQILFEATVGSWFSDIAIDDIAVILKGLHETSTKDSHGDVGTTQSEPESTNRRTERTTKPFHHKTTSATNIEHTSQSTISSRTIYRFITKTGLSSEEIVFVSIGIAVSFCFWSAIFVLVIWYVRTHPRSKWEMMNISHQLPLTDSNGGFAPEKAEETFTDTYSNISFSVETAA